MNLRQQMETSGRWLFCNRSYLPLLLLPAFVYPIFNFTYIGGSHQWDIVWDVLCVAISFTGLGIRALTIGHTPAGTSGRNTHDQVAETLNTTGMYSIVRHPLYLGNFLMWLGIALFPHNFYFAGLICLAFALYYERIMMAEEQYLREKFGERFEVWARNTPAILPAVWQWQPPNLPFSIRNVLKREYSGAYALVLLFTVMEVAGDYFVEGVFQLEPGWAGFLIVGTVAYLILRTLRKNTRILHVPGR